MPKKQMPVTTAPIFVELHCHCCGAPYLANRKKLCGCGEGPVHELKYCGNCLKCLQHCTCKKPRSVCDYVTAYAIHRSVA